MSTSIFGWNRRLDDLLAQSAFPSHAVARIVRADRGAYLMETGDRCLRGQCIGKMMMLDADEMPAVGDWVIYQPMGEDEGLILDMLPRSSRLVRVSSGRTSDIQVLVANADVAFLVMALDGDFNLSRLERYLAMVHGEAIQGIIVLTKADLCPDTESPLKSVTDIAGETPVVLVSSATGEGVEGLSRWSGPGHTIVLLGSSGVGKSTLINRLCGENHQRTGAVRTSDQRGKHTTTSRVMIPLPTGGVVIDTPGLRELVPLVDADSVAYTFAEIAELARECQFRDCHHEGDRGCAVEAAVHEGRLDARRLANFHKLRRETEAARLRNDQRLDHEKRRKGRSLSKMIKQAKAVKNSMRNG